MNYHMIEVEEVREAVTLFSREVRSSLKEQLVGIYIHGSLALGGFNPHSSDVDFLVVTKDIVTEDMFLEIEKIHNRISLSGSRWVNRLEGSYISKQQLLCKEPPIKPRPYFHDGELSWEQYGSEWILELYIIREHGIIIEGPRPQSLINSITAKELQKASVDILNQWWKPMSKDKLKLKDSEYQVYAVLTMCRILYMINHGCMVSKIAAAKWAQETLNEEWSRLIEKALWWKLGTSFDYQNDVVNFIIFTIKYASENKNRYRGNK